MPTYSYHCPACGDFDAVQPMSKSGLAVPCPTCACESERTLTVPALLGSRQHRAEPRTQGGNQEAASYRRWRHVSGCGCCR
jgi:putative FmdB family regulatory protein